MVKSTEKGAKAQLAIQKFADKKQLSKNDIKSMFKTTDSKKVNFIYSANKQIVKEVKKAPETAQKTTQDGIIERVK